MERPRFFSLQQKREHRETVGDNCEWETSKGQRCENTRLEADHVVPFSKGGETESDNILLSCLPHHAIKHLLDGEPWSYRLILSRMSESERQQLEDLGYGE
jgi:5-methylcytosine-specific restriction endonuclease McrA